MKKNEGEFEHFRREKLKTESQMNVISKNLRAEIEEFLSECGV